MEVAKLAEVFQTSPITIRRDLVELQEKGLLERTRGGAVSGAVLAHGWARYESVDYQERYSENHKAKKAIAEAAAQFVSDGDSLLINAGTTAHLFAESLRAHRQLHVITNGLTVATELGRSYEASVHMLPGQVDFRKMGVVEWPLPSRLDQMRVRAAFLGVHALSTTHGIAMNARSDALLNKAFMGMASEVTVLADASKFKAHAIFHLCAISHVQRIITDDRIEPQTLDALHSSGTEVIVVES